MPIPPGRYELGPEQGKLLVHTKKAGAAAKAGHDLVIAVGAWSATLEAGADGAPAALTLTADSSSLRVLEGTGGIQKLGDDEKASIEQSIAEEVLKGGTIEFRSTSVAPGEEGGPLRVEGELELLGSRQPLSFELTAAADGRLTGTARIKQTDFGIKPYSALFGTLKVVDEIDVEFDGQVPIQS